MMSHHHYNLAKRIFDFGFALILLMVLSPLLVVLACLVGMNLGCPIFFRHTRPGLGGKPFVLYKFRTMTDERDEYGRHLPDAMRLKAFGKLLRSLSMDELPELFNVLKGDMSLVGPRPLLMEYLERYNAEQARRHEVVPGVTGWAQINGRNALTWEDKFKLDVWYVEHRSLPLDLKILVTTVFKAIKREGISQPGHATAEKFKG
jgi:sugar transferase EpsL